MCNRTLDVYEEILFPVSAALPLPEPTHHPAAAVA